MTTELNLPAQLDLNRIDPALRAAAAGLDVLDFDAATLPLERDPAEPVPAHDVRPLSAWSVSASLD